MASKPLRALLEQRLELCKMTGTSITEDGITVSADKLNGEFILFFRIDSEAGRNCLDMAGLRACDCLVFYTLETQQEEDLCLLELKAAGLDQAAEQIFSAYYKVKQLLATSHIQCATWKAFVCLRHNVPAGDLRHVAKLKSHFGKDNFSYKTVKKQYKEFGSFLRR